MLDLWKYGVAGVQDWWTFATLGRQLIVGGKAKFGEVAPHLSQARLDERDRTEANEKSTLVDQL